MITIYNPITGDVIGTVNSDSLCNAITVMIANQPMDDISLDYSQDGNYNPTMSDIISEVERIEHNE